MAFVRFLDHLRPGALANCNNCSNNCLHRPAIRIDDTFKLSGDQTLIINALKSSFNGDHYPSKISMIILQLQEENFVKDSNISALLDQLNREGFWSQVQRDQDNRITAILFAHPSSLSYLQVSKITLPSS